MESSGSPFRFLVHNSASFEEAPSASNATDSDKSRVPQPVASNAVVCHPITPWVLLVMLVLVASWWARTAWLQHDDVADVSDLARVPNVEMAQASRSVAAEPSLWRRVQELETQLGELHRQSQSDMQPAARCKNLSCQ